MATKARQQYFADEDSLQKIRREFSIADDIQQKIDSIEPGAQVNKIETVKVNGTALVPDANKAVNVEVPEVIDNLYTVDSDNALSAKQGKLLYDYIQNIASRGRFLSNWNSATGLPMTNPSESPYPYKSGDYFVVSNVATSGGTNYRPDGSSYIIGQASTVVETDSVDVSDFYFYDGTNWLLLKNSGRSGAVDSALSTTSTNPVENRVITNALNGKQETLIAGNNIQIAADGKTISATDTTYSAGANISIDANNEISAVDTTYTAGTNVQISNQNVISATDTKYTAGTGINIDANNVISNTQTSAQWGNITGTLSNQTDLQNALDSKVNLGMNQVFDSTVVEIGKWEQGQGGASSGHHITLDPNGEVSTYNVTTGGHNEATLGSGTLTVIKNTAIGGDEEAVYNHESIVADNGTDTETYNFFGNNRIARLSDVGGTYSAGNGINISAQNAISVDTSVVATQTDLDGKVSKGVNTANGDLFSIESGNYSTSFGPDFIRSEFSSGANSTYSGLQPGSLGSGNNNKESELSPDSLSLTDSTNMTQTTYAEGGITVVDNGYGTSEAFEFAGGGNNQIARLKDVKTYTAGDGINIDANNEISNTLPGPTIAATAPTGTEGALWYDTTNDVLMAHNGTVWKEAGTQMKVLSYGHSTWQDFLDAYNENAIVYCKASSNANPGSGNQGRMAFMAFIDINSSTQAIQGVEFQYYRSRSAHSTAANVLDEVYIYKLTPASGGTWTVTQRDTAAKPLAGTGIGLTYNASGMTISADTTVLATQTDLNSKQDTLVSGTNIKTVNNESLLGSGNITISAPTYNAGPGIEINNNSISAKAGTGIAVGDGSTDYSAMRGPCPNGYHIPLHTEHQDLVNMWTALGFGTSSGIDFVTYFHTPTSCSRWSNGNNQGFSGVAISWSANKAPDGFYVLSAYADPAYPSENYVETDYMLGLYESFGHPIRAFKDAPVIPDSNWTTVYQGTGSAGIYHNATLGLISVSSDGTNWITLKDKNEGATTVWNYGDALSAANVGNVYQRGNNYGFPRTGTITTSNTQVDASNYGPGNYYSSSTFITTTPYRDSSQNRNLRGGVTGIVVHPNGITNTGVLSVNGQTGAVTINEFNPGGTATTGYVVTKTANGYQWQAPTGGLQLAPNSPITGIKYIWYGTETDYANLSQYYTDTPGDTEFRCF